MEPGRTTSTLAVDRLHQQQGDPIEERHMFPLSPELSLQQHNGDAAELHHRARQHDLVRQATSDRRADRRSPRKWLTAAAGRLHNVLAHSSARASTTQCAEVGRIDAVPDGGVQAPGVRAGLSPTPRHDRGHGVDEPPRSALPAKFLGRSAEGRIDTRRERRSVISAAKPLICRFGWHKWARRSTEDGSPYMECARCQTVDDRTPPPPGVMSAGF
jgi:hypothetical protein